MLILGVHFSLIVQAGMGLDAVRLGKVNREWGTWLTRIGGGAFALLFPLYLFDPAKAVIQRLLSQHLSRRSRKLQPC